MKDKEDKFLISKSTKVTLMNKQTQESYVSDLKEQFKGVAKGENDYDRWAANYDQEVQVLLNYQAPYIFKQ